MKHTYLGLAALFLTAGLASAAAPKTPSRAAAKKPAAAVKYKAVCGMTYTAAEAKKHNFVCPMDKQRLVKVAPKAQKAAVKKAKK